MSEGMFAYTNENAIAYYIPGTVGWGASYGGLPTAEWSLPIADVDLDYEVNLYDFSVFAGAWGAEDGQNQYDPLCDISDPVDGIINFADLEVFVDEWLITPCP
jgi:hypothetical protein